MAIVDFSSGDADPELTERIRGARGWIPNLFRVLLHSPPLADGWVSLANAFRGGCALDDRSRELAILLVAHLRDSEYEWGHHERVARGLGVSDAELRALRAWPDTAQWSEDERALLELVACTVLGEAVSPQTVQRLGASGGEQRVVEIAGLSAYYVAVSHLSAVLELEPDAPPPR